MATTDSKLSFTCPKTINVAKHKKLKDEVKVVIEKFLGEQEDATLLEYIATMLDNNKSLNDIALELEPFFENENFSFALNLHDILFDTLQQQQQQQEITSTTSSSSSPISKINESFKTDRERKNDSQLLKSSSSIDRRSKRKDNTQTSSIEDRIGNKRDIRGDRDRRRDRNRDRSRRDYDLNSNQIDYRDNDRVNKRRRNDVNTSTTTSSNNNNNNNQNSTNSVAIMEAFQDNMKKMMEMGEKMGWMPSHDPNSSIRGSIRGGRGGYPNVRGGRGSSRGRGRNSYYKNHNSFNYNNNNNNNYYYDNNHYNLASDEAEGNESKSNEVITDLTDTNNIDESEINNNDNKGPAIYDNNYAVNEFPSIRGGRGRGRGRINNRGRGRGTIFTPGRETFQNTTYVRSANMDSALSTLR